MERRKMLNLIGLGGLVTWPGTSRASADMPRWKKDIRFFATFTQLQRDKKLKSGDLATTLGFHEVNDGGGAQYRIEQLHDKNGEPGLPCGVFQLDNGLAARLINVKTVNYPIFGARVMAKLRMARQFWQRMNSPMRMNYPCTTFPEHIGSVE